MPNPIGRDSAKTVVLTTDTQYTLNPVVSPVPSISMQGIRITLILTKTPTAPLDIHGFVSSDKINLGTINPVTGFVTVSGGYVRIGTSSGSATTALLAATSGQAYGLVSGGFSGSYLITGTAITGKIGGHDTITVGKTNAIVTTYGTGNTVNMLIGDGVINAGSGGATVTTGVGNVTINLSGTGNTVKTGYGIDLVKGTASSSTILLNHAADELSLTGNQNTITGSSQTYVTGNGNTLTSWGDSFTSVSGNSNVVNTGAGDFVEVAGDQNIVKVSPSSTVSVSGSKDVVFLASNPTTQSNAASVYDDSKGLTLVAGPSVGDNLVAIGADTSFVLDLIGGVGGITSAAQAYASLQTDGADGAILNLGSTFIDFFGPSSSHITASNFAVMPTYHAS